jgi:protein-S-isoprenylcysteine O-methyltransferase Ste14
MYLGAGTALAGAAFYYRSLPLLGYTLGFLVLMHLFAVLYEEPVLRATFGAQYEEYCRRVRRWLPRRGSGPERPHA